MIKATKSDVERLKSIALLLEYIVLNEFFLAELLELAGGGGATSKRTRSTQYIPIQMQ